MARRLTRLPLSLAVAFALFGSVTSLPHTIAAAPSPSTYADDECQTFPPQHAAICKPFLPFWLDHGGLAQLGYPLAGAFDEVSPSDGRTYQTQYFERARFEYHPESAPPYDVQLGLLGREQYLTRYPTGAPVAIDNPFSDPRLPQECVTFPATGKKVCGPFLAYWRAHGGLEQQGLPLTDIFMETNPTDGNQYPTQYFERARFEYHAGQGDTPGTVLLGLLGSEQFQVRYPLGVPGSDQAGNR